GLKHEQFEGASITTSEDINYQPAYLYQRHKNLLPHTQYPAKTALWRWYRNHPIFTSSIAVNHLVSLNEIIALYLLTWSPELWELVNISKDVDGLSPANTARWQNEWQHLLGFKAGLGQVRRFMAHIPVYMMFDDHDVTDDWNLTAKWEQA
ncbi:alkaline phosphatase family protein, partial [Pseudomonas saponiphila]